MPPLRIFFKKLGRVYEVLAVEGDSLLEVAHKNGVDLEGACEGSMACSTCHVVLPKEVFDRLGEPCDKEYDLLDQAYGGRSTSRLGCQVKTSKELENKTIEIPRVTRNL